MHVEPVADEITGTLRRVGPGSRQGHRPSAQADFGVYVADLRRIVREYRKRLAGESGEFVYRLGLALLARRISECRQVAYELTAGHPAARDSLNVKRIEFLGEGIDNWACVDSFCCTLVGRAWREGRITDATIKRWSRSPDLWWRRAAVVATVPLNVRARGGAGDPDRTLVICDLLVCDREAIVQKAISWALRELVEWDRAGVERFLAEHAETVSALVRREVRRKLDTGSKNRRKRRTP